MTSNVLLDGLLLTRDAQVLCILKEVLERFTIKTEVCTELDTALDALRHRRLDAVIVDWNDAYDSILVLRTTRTSAPNSRSTIVAIVDGGSEMQAALQGGANFLIHKPSNLDHVIRCLRAAYGTILQERRRAARCPVDIPVLAKVAEVGQVVAKISDLSIGGLALQCKKPLDIDRMVSLGFLLPATDQLIHVTGKVVNTDGKSRAGIWFSPLPPYELNVLEGWLASEMAKLENAEIPTGNANKHWHGTEN